MRTGFMIIMLAALAGCMSMQTTKAPADELHRQLRAGGLVDPGDRIRVTMSDGTKQTIEVFRVDEDALHGHTADGELVEAPIDDIAVLATEEFSIVRSTVFAYVGIPVIYGGILFTLLFLSYVL